MITEEEKLEIIDRAVEKTLLTLPEVVGNLMTNHVAMSKINSDFYKKYPEFKEHKDSVVSVIEMLEGKDPTIEYQELLNRSVPEIRRRISIMGKTDTKTVSPNFNKDFSSMELSNGSI